MFVLIKGTPQEAREAANKRGITLGEQTYCKEGQTGFYCSATDYDRVQSWYCEDLGAAAYTTGSMLHYSLADAMVAAKKFGQDII